jgi:enoyl-[acyl-carrier-protein] reductase (NADH)
MNTEVPRMTLENKKALVVGIANDQCIAYGCARALLTENATPGQWPGF